MIVTHRPKYGCRVCEGAIVQAPAPERLIKSGIPTEGLVASVVVDKFAWHNPLYRQAQIMKLQGLPVDRSTLAFWVGVAAAELKPVYLRMKEILLGSAKIAVDETRAPVLVGSTVQVQVACRFFHTFDQATASVCAEIRSSSAFLSTSARKLRDLRLIEPPHVHVTFGGPGCAGDVASASWSAPRPAPPPVSLFARSASHCLQPSAKSPIDPTDPKM